MAEAFSDQRDNRGDWRPGRPIPLAPINQWPMNLRAVSKWLVRWPGYLWPYNALWLIVAVITWLFLTPSLDAMRTIEAWWVGAILARNLGLTLLIFGGLHLYLYVWQKQGQRFRFSLRSPASNQSRFVSGNQLRDNMFHTLVYGVPVFSAYEILSYWGFANGVFGLIPIDTNGIGFWLWAALWLVLAPVIHSLHFYFGHRLLHTKLLYQPFHALHHRNVDIGPWSGLSMHPVEHVIYFSTVLVQWLVALHPLNALYQIQLAAFLPALSHSGFERLEVAKNLDLEGGSHFHYLHHKHFECNYGGSLVPLDRLFGTYHDGTVQADEQLRETLKARRRALA